MYTSVCTMANISYKMFQNVGKQRGAKSSNKYVHRNESVRFHNVPVDTLNTFNHFLFCEKFWKTLCQGGKFFSSWRFAKYKWYLKKELSLSGVKTYFHTFRWDAEQGAQKNLTEMWLTCDWKSDWNMHYTKLM